MRIEQNWDDCFVYLVSLEVPASPRREKWFTNRTIVLKNELNFSEMKDFIKKTIGPEVTLLNVDLWDEGLVAKEW